MSKAVRQTGSQGRSREMCTYLESLVAVLFNSPNWNTDSRSCGYSIGSFPKREGITLTRCSLFSRGQFAASPQRDQPMATPLTSAKHPSQFPRPSSSTRHPQNSKLPAHWVRPPSRSNRTCTSPQPEPASSRSPWKTRPRRNSGACGVSRER